MPSRLERLQDTRDTLLRAIEGCDSNRDLSALTREYRATLAEIDELPDHMRGSAADEIAERRSKRQAGSHSRSRTAN